MQGKRVGMYQNPTTEMFDHGVDSCVTVLTAICMCKYVLAVDSSPIVLLVLCAVGFTGFHSPTYEHLITNKMIFRGGPTNPTEALIITQVVLVIAGLFPTFFHSPFIRFLVVAASVASVLSLAHSIHELFIYYKKDVNKTIHSTLRGYGPLFFVISLSLVWFPFLGDFYKNHSTLCMLTLALPWNYSIFRTIINEITAVKNLDTMSVLTGQLPAVIPAISHVVGIPMIIALPITFALSAFMYFYTVVVSLREVCDALGMEHFWSIRDERKLKK
ncbi:cholinephosphotransferase [Acrasis kona]|uniref:Cholinephosphotransferase n=1 Tax=Acrasis kona TaxID=1008807 RepID=A0AAW2ZN32_9EUKA